LPGLTVEKDFVSYEYGNGLFYGYTTYFKPWDMYFTVAVSEAELMAGINTQIIGAATMGGGVALILGILILAMMNRQFMSSMDGMA